MNNNTEIKDLKLKRQMQIYGDGGYILDGNKIEKGNYRMEYITKCISTIREVADKLESCVQQLIQPDNIKLADIPVAESFKIDKYEFVVLEHSGDTTAVILKELLFKDEKFGTSNNYKDSHIDKLCGDFANVISNVIGKGNLIEHTVDLTSDDGLKDYGKIKRKMSLLTTNLYRRYVEILDKYKVNKWWWLATADSTPTHNISKLVKYVSPSGFVFFSDFYNVSGVRPFCILKSNIFVSK